MKKIYLSIISTAFLFNTYGQNVAEIQTPLVVKKTATWCNPCGTWGWDLFDEVWNGVNQRSVILEMHDDPGSGLYSSDAEKFYNLHEQRSSTPVFYVNTINEVEYTSGGVNAAATKVNVLSAVDLTAQQSPIVNSGFTQTITGSTLKVVAKVKFFQNTTGEYYLGMYITEDDVVANQSGRTAPVTHTRIMRASAYPDIEGTLVSTGDVSAGAEFYGSRTYTLDPNWNTANIKVFTVIWEKVEGELKYVNAHQIDGTLSTHQLTENELDVKLYPNVSYGYKDIMLEVNGASNKRISIEVYNQIGMKINTIFSGELKSDQETFNVNPSKSLSKGMYFVNITSDDNSRKTIKMIVG